MAKNLEHFFQLNEQDTSDKAWGENSNVNTIGTVWETATEDEVNACANGEEVELSIDLKKFADIGMDFDSVKNKPYVFVYFHWEYTLDDFPGYTFSSIQLATKPAENTAFKK